ncbi:Organic cation/carnitine transporter 2 [Dendrobium catenatum]|uniref:H(+)/Pi cotransporter n=1 Tax=Dendrobium catenatum TaxID=906689 RepID=A0A2I0WYJ6_9ASPA|nr:Organic cation/carnitine transporter 2 [Dendrobium catenatum]
MVQAPTVPPPSAGETTGDHTVEINQNSSKTTVINSIDDIVEHYMSAAAGALFFPFLACLAWIFDSQQTFINVFSDKPPPWHCTSSTCNFTTPCDLPSTASWSFSQPRKISTISDFSIECSSPVLLALPASSFYAGCLVGGLSLATLADSRFGRKNTLILSSLTMSLAAALTAFSPNLAVYAALRFTCGFARANVGTSAFVLSSELVSRRYRNHVSILTFIFSTTGFLTLPAIAFLNRAHSWRLLYLYTSIPSLFYSILLLFFMKESPRWLLLKGKRKEAIETLKKLTSLKEIQSFPDLAVTYSKKTESEGLYSAARILFEKPWALQRLAAIMIMSFGVGLMYYGMPLNLGNLNVDLYMSAALNAASELPSAFVVFFLANVVSRRRSLIGFVIVSGGCSLACTAMGGWPAMVLEMVAFFGACAAFYMEVIYTVELFPTCVRNSALAVVRQAVVLGGVAAPTMVAAGRSRKFLSFGVFGIVIILCGVFIVFLPETRGRAISDTMEEEEHKMMEGRKNIYPSS